MTGYVRRSWCSFMTLKPVYDRTMPRRRQHHLPEEVFRDQGTVVSITMCTADRGRWLGRPELATIAVDEVLRVHRDHPVLGYCLMPDHVHLMLCNAGSPLGTIVNGFKGRTSRRVHAVDSDLRVWQTGYWDHLVRRNEGLTKVLEYILLNPVRKRLVERWWDYPWLGLPMIGEVGPDFLTTAPPEDVLWSEILRV